MIKGISVVNCIYVNPIVGQFWMIDYCIYDPEGNGQTKLDHVQQMQSLIVFHKQLPFETVSMNSWYATKELMLQIERLLLLLERKFLGGRF